MHFGWSEAATYWIYRVVGGLERANASAGLERTKVAILASSGRNDGRMNRHARFCTHDVENQAWIIQAGAILDVTICKLSF